MRTTFDDLFWGNYTNLSEVVALAARGEIRHAITTFGFGQINENLELLRAGKIIGGAVMKF